MQINQNNTINGDSSNSKMLYVGCLVFYSFLLFLNVAQIVPIFREQWKTSGSTSSPWSRGCLLPCSRRKGSNTGNCASNSLWDGPTNHPHLEVKCIESRKNFILIRPWTTEEKAMFLNQWFKRQYMGWKKGQKNLLKLVDKYLRVNKSGFRRKQM